LIVFLVYRRHKMNANHPKLEMKDFKRVNHSPPREGSASPRAFEESADGIRKSPMRSSFDDPAVLHGERTTSRPSSAEPMLDGGMTRGNKGKRGRQSSDADSIDGSPKETGNTMGSDILDSFARSRTPETSIDFDNEIDPAYKLTPEFRLLEKKIQEFIEDNRFSLMYVNFIHVTGGKCKLNGKKIDVKMNENGDLFVGAWTLKEFIRTIGTKVKPGTIGFDGTGTVGDQLVNGIPSVIPSSSNENNEPTNTMGVDNSQARSSLPPLLRTSQKPVKWST